MQFGNITSTELPTRYSGFTIVELLIVIVVIAILAAISLVAYTGVQNSANDAAVQSDIRNWANILKVYEVEHEGLPQVGTEIGPQTASSLQLKASRGAYDTSITYNVYICKAQNGESFGIAAKSKSGKIFAYNSSNGFIQYSGPIGGAGNSSSVCPVVAGSPFFLQVGYHSNSWGSWTE